MAFYRWPALLRKIETRLAAEDIGDRCRSAATKVQNPSIGAALANLYLLGREWLINMGLLRPQDAAEDIIYLLDFRKRFQLSFHRNDGHISNKEFGHRAQILPERQLQVFHADMTTAPWARRCTRRRKASWRRPRVRVPDIVRKPGQHAEYRPL